MNGQVSKKKFYCSIMTETVLLCQKTLTLQSTHGSTLPFFKQMQMATFGEQMSGQVSVL